MQLLSAGLQQTAVGDFVGKGVLEGVLKVGKELRLVEEFCRLQACKVAPEHVLRRIHNPLEDAEWKVLADGRGRLQEPFFLVRQAIDARRQGGLYRRSDLDGLKRTCQVTGTGLAAQHARLHQCAETL